MKNKIHYLLLIYIYLIVGLFFISKTTYVVSIISLQSNTLVNYLTLVTSYFLVGALFLFMIIKNKMDIFEPFIFCSVIMIILYIITPIINYLINDLLCFGEDVMHSTLKATWIFNISYFSFCIGYGSIRNKYKTINTRFTFSRFYVKRRSITKFALIMWLFCFVCSLIYIMNNGASLSYILTMGVAGNVSSQDLSGTPLGFIGMFGYSLVTIWMIIVVFSKNRILKSILGILTVFTYIVRGFRFIIVIMILAPIVFYYIRKGKRPSKFILIIIGLILILMIGLVGFVRNSLRNGDEIIWAGLNFDIFIDALKGNFDIYKSYYGVIRAIPNLMSFTYGKQLSYTFLMFIPRLIWPSKPLPLQSQIVELGLNSVASKSGFAFPNLGEYYSEFGLIGCILILFILGRVTAKLKKLYLSENRDEFSIIMYCVLLPACMQLIIRGYTPSNFYLILFLIIPIIVTRFVIGGKNEKGKSNSCASG